MCKTHALIADKHGNHHQARLFCGTWRCQYCADNRLKPEWKAHLCGLAAKYGSLYRTEIPKSDWIRVSKRLWRNGSQQAKLSFGNHFVVWSTQPTEGSSEHTTKQAISGIRHDINQMPLAKRAISTSRRWAKPRRQSRGNQLVAILPHADLAAVKARTHGIPFRPTTTGGILFQTGSIEQPLINRWRISILMETVHRRILSTGKCPNYPSPYKDNSDIDRFRDPDLDAVNALLATEDPFPDAS